MLAIITMMAASPPTPIPGPKPIGDTAAWISNNDYPSDALQAEASGTVEIEIVVDENGHGARCRVSSSSGTESLDKIACAAFMRRGSWEPTLDEAGKPMFAIYRRRISWSLNDAGIPLAPVPADIEIEVAKLPVPAAQARVVLRQIQRADGSVESCIVDSPSAAPVLNRIACRIAEPLTKPGPIVNVAGELVRGARWRTVQFVEQAKNGVVE